jgi:trafficking protein particle complex subunit 10
MEKPKVQVTYSAPPLFLLSDNWLQIRDALAAQFPLRDITWKPTWRPFTRNIETLDVSLLAFEDIKENRASVLASSGMLLQRPLLNIYVVACEVIFSIMLSYLQTEHLLPGHRFLQILREGPYTRMA